MSEFKGTKGKWFTHKGSNYVGVVGKPTRITHVNGSNLLDEDFANALLISKAPEMLDMLNNILKERKEVGNHVPFQEIEQLIKEATEL